MYCPACPLAATRCPLRQPGSINTLPRALKIHACPTCYPESGLQHPSRARSCLLADYIYPAMHTHDRAHRLWASTQFWQQCPSALTQINHASDGLLEHTRCCCRHFTQGPLSHGANCRNLECWLSALSQMSVQHTRRPWHLISATTVSRAKKKKKSFPCPIKD